MREAELIVARLRSELKIEHLPCNRDGWRLAEHLVNRITLEIADLPVAYILPGVPAVVTIPAGWDEGRQVRALLHEIGHALCCPATPVHLVSSDLGAERLLRLWEGREERLAREFMLAWLLPAEIVLKMLEEGEEVLAYLSGLTIEEVRDRIRMLFP